MITALRLHDGNTVIGVDTTHAMTYTIKEDGSVFLEYTSVCVIDKNESGSMVLKFVPFLVFDADPKRVIHFKAHDYITEVRVTASFVAQFKKSLPAGVLPDETTTQVFRG